MARVQVTCPHQSGLIMWSPANAVGSVPMICGRPHAIAGVLPRANCPQGPPEWNRLCSNGGFTTVAFLWIRRLRAARRGKSPISIPLLLNDDPPMMFGAPARSPAFWVAVTIKVVLIGLLAFGAFSGLQQFEGKAFLWRPDHLSCRRVCGPHLLAGICAQIAVPLRGRHPAHPAVP